MPALTLRCSAAGRKASLASASLRMRSRWTRRWPAMQLSRCACCALPSQQFCISANARFTSTSDAALCRWARALCVVIRDRRCDCRHRRRGSPRRPLLASGASETGGHRSLRPMQAQAAAAVAAAAAAAGGAEALLLRQALGRCRGSGRSGIRTAEAAEAARGRRRETQVAMHSRCCDVSPSPREPAPLPTAISRGFCADH